MTTTFTLPKDPDFKAMARIKQTLESTYDHLNRYIERMNQQLEVAAPRIFTTIPVCDRGEIIGALSWMKHANPDAWELGFARGADKAMRLPMASLRERLCSVQQIQTLTDELMAEAVRRTEEFEQELAKLT